MDHENHVETVIIGGGQAGISVSYQLKLQDRDHVILEQAPRAADAWRNHRWESFTLSTPNWQSQLPGAPLPGTDPDGFAKRDEVVRYFENYIRRNRIPIRYGVRVHTVKANEELYVVETTCGTFTARNVVVATGICQRPQIPRFKGTLSPEILELHADSYWKPSYLPSGAVLVVGSGQSGAQIAEDLYQNGRTVYLSVSRSGRVPRRYRGKDINWWSNALGLYERTANDLKSPRDKFASKSHISGTMGGHTLNLHQFAADGVNLLGRVLGLKDNTILLARDLHKNLAGADRLESSLTARIDSFIHQHGLLFPEEVLPCLTAGFDQPERDSLDLKQAGVTSVIWATGYGFDFGIIRLPIFDAEGYPIQQSGVTGYLGLYFVGLPWLNNARSGLFFGLKEESKYIAAQIAERDGPDALGWVMPAQWEPHASCEL
jgi:putative flavoprotein involved in K+ transport